jgi:hypothetical protein
MLKWGTRTMITLSAVWATGRRTDGTREEQFKSKPTSICSTQQYNVYITTTNIHNKAQINKPAHK